jgi:hypothetical protein
VAYISQGGVGGAEIEAGRAEGDDQHDVVNVTYVCPLSFVVHWIAYRFTRTSLDRIEELARTMANATINSAEETPPNIEGVCAPFSCSD